MAALEAAIQTLGISVSWMTGSRPVMERVGSGRALFASASPLEL